MKNLLLLTSLFCLCFVTSNNTFAAMSVASSSTVIAEATPASATLTKKQIKKQVRQEKKMKRKAKFAAWIAKVMDNERMLLAAILALFLGGLGIHRVYLGSKPIIILWYILTFGGIFGLIPLIDFFRIIFGGTEHYDGRDGLFACFK